MADPDFSLVLDREESGEALYCGVAWLNETVFGPSIKVNVSEDLEKDSVLKLVPRKGFSFTPARVSKSEPDLRVKHGKRKEFVGEGWIVEDEWGGKQIKFTLKSPVAAGEIIFINPKKGVEDLI